LLGEDSSEHLVPGENNHRPEDDEWATHNGLAAVDIVIT
jgi:hypothetical protein